MSGDVLPNWIIAGAPRASTTSLFRWLCDHPQVDGSSEKETYYFTDPGTHMFRPHSNFRDHGIDGYRKLFAGCDRSARVIVESTPAYLYSQTALRELPRLPTTPSFLFVLREPVAQIHSLFTYFQQNWNWIPRTMSFRDFISAVEKGESGFRGNELAANALRNAWYPVHLRRWREAVGAERMLILLFEDLVSDSRASMRLVANRLGIDPPFYNKYEFPRENATYVVRSSLLQNFNILIRGHLPKGRWYDAVRRLYRAANTEPPILEQTNPDVDRLLARRFAPMLSELEDEFALDLGRWRSAPGARAPAASTREADGAASAAAPDLDRPEYAR